MSFVLPNHYNKGTTEIIRSTYNSLCNRKPDKIEKNILKQNHENGVIELTDIVEL